MKFSLRTLLAAAALLCVGAYVLVYATPVWAAIAYTLCVGLLLAAIVCACAATGQPRFFWLGFAVFGWGYLVVLHSPIFSVQAADRNWQVHYSGPPLVTRAAIDWMWDKVLPVVHEPPQWDQSMTKTINGSRFPNGFAFSQVGHTLSALIFAVVGGACGRFAYWRYRVKRD